MKKWISVLLAACILLPLFAACQLTDREKPGENDLPAELDLEAVAAKVGEETITLGAVKTLFDNYVNYFSYYGYDVTSDEETLFQFQDDIVNKLVEEKLLALKARELGYDKFTSEQQAEIGRRVQEELDGMAEYYREQAEEDFAADGSIDVEARIEALILEEAAYNMSKDDVTYEEYTAYIREDLTRTYLAELLFDGELGDVSVPEEDVIAAFNAQLTADQAAYEEDPAAYQAAQETYETTGEGLPALFVPEGYARIYDIFIPFEGDLAKEYEANQKTMDERKRDYQELAFADALAGTADNAARMAEILAEYMALKGENDQLYAAHTASARELIDALYAKLQAGADFKELMLANTKNENFTKVAVFTERGMLITTEYDADDSWGDATKEAFAALSAGAYSEPFAESDGLHIIFRLGDEKAGPLENAGETYERVRAQALKTAKDEEWTALLTEWKNGDSVALYKEVYRVLGTTTVG